MSPGQGIAFSDLEGDEPSTLTVVLAEDGFVYIEISSESRRMVRFIASPEQAEGIAKAIRAATKRGDQ